MSTFNYFGYASNLTPYKVGMRCRSCRKYGIGKLEGHKITFNGYSDEWKGGTATMETDKSSILWGVIWTIDESEMPLLDDQEGVSTGKYRAITVEVKDSNDKTLKCRMYQQTDGEKKQTAPSPQYLEVILDGARTSGIPTEYIALLETVDTNENTEITKLMEEVDTRREELTKQSNAKK